MTRIPDGAAYAPFDAPLEDFLAHLDGLGFAAGVLVDDPRRLHGLR